MKKCLFIILFFSLHLFSQDLGELSEFAFQLLNQGNIEEAIKNFENVLSSAEVKYGKDNLNYCRHMNNLASAYVINQNFVKAESLYLECKKLIDKYPKDKELNSLIYLGLSETYKLINKKTEVEKYLTKAISEIGSNSQLYLVINEKLLDFYTDIGNKKKIDSLTTILKSYKNINTNDDFHSLNLKASQCYSEGKFEESLEYLLKAETILDSTDNSSRFLKQNLKNNIALVLKNLNRYSEALQILIENLKEKKLYFDTHPSIIYTLSSIADIYFEIGDYQNAKSNYKELINIMFEIVNNYFYFLDDNERVDFWEQFKALSNNLFTFGAIIYNDDPSFLLDLLDFQVTIKSILLKSNKKIKNIINSINDYELNNLFAKWVELKSEISSNNRSSETIENTLNDKISKIEKEINKKIKQLNYKLISNNFDYTKLINSLDSNQAYIDIYKFKFANEKISYAVFIVKKGLTIPEFMILQNGSEIEKAFYKYINKIKAKHNDDTISFSVFWKQIYDKTKDCELVFFSPDGIYNLINPNTLKISSNSYIIDKMLIININDPMLINNLRTIDSTKQINKSAYLFGSPTFNLNTNNNTKISTKNNLNIAYSFLNKIKPLKATENEVRNIDSLLSKNGFKVKSYLHDEASEKNLKKVKDPTILHIATHGFFLPSDQNKNRINLLTKTSSIQNALKNSGLILAGAVNYYLDDTSLNDSTENGLLNSLEISNMSLDGTELVVLSACETGTGDVVDGEGVFGLQRALQIAGAKFCLISLWKIDDEVTSEMIPFFYEQWLNSGNKILAFRDTQKKIKEKYPAPYFWGPFISLVNE